MVVGQINLKRKNLGQEVRLERHLEIQDGIMTVKAQDETTHVIVTKVEMHPGIEIDTNKVETGIMIGLTPVIPGIMTETMTAIDQRSHPETTAGIVTGIKVKKVRNEDIVHLALHPVVTLVETIEACQKVQV